MRRFLGGLVALGLLVGEAEEAKADYVFTTIDVPGFVNTTASGINNAGQIVGDCQVSGDGYHGFLLGERQPVARRRR
jgi:hypothetical protein